MKSEIPSSSPKRRWKRIFLWVVFPVLLLALAEAAVRLNEIHNFQRFNKNYNHYLFRVTPDKNYRFLMRAGIQDRRFMGFETSGRTYGYQINNLGFRGPIMEEKKPAGVKRILVMGDSIPFGIGVEDNETFPFFLEKGLQRKFGKDKIQVVNGCIPGYNVTQVYWLLKELTERLEPDAVVVNYSMDDAEPQFSVAEKPEEVYRDAGLWVWEEIKEDVINKILAKVAPKAGPLRVNKRKPLRHDSVLVGYEPHSWKWKKARSSLEKIGDLCRRRGIFLMVTLLPNIGEGDPGVNPYQLVADKVGEWCRDFKIPYWDLFPEFASRGPQGRWLVEDGHYSIDANKVLAEITEEALLPKLGG